MAAVNPATRPAPPGRLEIAEGRVREVVGGDRRAAIRRIILWVALTYCIVSGQPPEIAMLPALLLMLTDQLL
jgi:hypothetical protein